jgi:alkaline phosphatase D
MDADLAAAHASAPFIVTWDDHEVDNDYAGHLDERNTPSELFLLRRAAAYQAYYENMPLRASTLPHGPNLQLYRRLQFGRLVDFSVLDTRQFRDKQACTGRPGCGDVRDTRRTILGPAQETWLYENLARSQGTWTVLGQQVPTFARDNVRVNPEARFSMDKWDGYPGARDRLYSRILEAGTPNPVLLSGDVHLHYAADLKRDFADPRSATLGVELTNTSITSGGDGSAVSGTWEQTRGDNPHIKYHGARRGYIACTVTPRTLQADFKVLDRVTVPDSPARIDTTVTAEAGKPGLA